MQKVKEKNKSTCSSMKDVVKCKTVMEKNAKKKCFCLEIYEGYSHKNSYLNVGHFYITTLYIIIG